MQEWIQEDAEKLQVLPQMAEIDLVNCVILSTQAGFENNEKCPSPGLHGSESAGKRYAGVLHMVSEWTVKSPLDQHTLCHRYLNGRYPGCSPDVRDASIF